MPPRTSRSRRASAWTTYRCSRTIASTALEDVASLAEDQTVGAERGAVVDGDAQRHGPSPHVAAVAGRPSLRRCVPAHRTGPFRHVPALRLESSATVELQRTVDLAVCAVELDRGALLAHREGDVLGAPFARPSPAP